MKPKLINLTPAHLRCDVWACPAVYEDQTDNLIIIGARISQSVAHELTGKIGEGEVAIKIKKEFLSNIFTTEERPTYRRHT